MTDFRQIHVSIWKDEWFLDLDPNQKLLFIYLFSNANTRMCGLYKLPMRVLVFETGFDQEYILATLEKFSKDGKVHYQDGVVWVVNMVKYHSSKSPKVKANIINDIEKIPDCPLKIAYLKANNIVSIQYPYSINTQSQEKRREENIREDNSSAATDESLQFIAERLTGLPATPKDMSTLRAWERDGVTENDIRDALQWRKESNIPPIKSISQLAGGVSTSRARRIQSESARKTGPPFDPAAHASEVYN